MAITLLRLTDNRVQLGREELIRPLAFGTNWNVLRLAALVQTYASSTITAPTLHQLLSIGVCTGTSSPIQTDATVDTVGAGAGSALSGNVWTWTNAGGFQYLLITGAGATAFQKIGGTYYSAFTGATAGRLSAVTYFGANNIQRCPFIVDIAKSTYSTGAALPYTLTVWTPNSDGNMADISPGTFFDRIQSLSAPTGVATLGATSLAAMTGNALHDTAYIHWNRNNPALEVSAFAAIRYS